MTSKSRSSLKSEYGNQRAYLARVAAKREKRICKITDVLKEAFSGYIRREIAEFIYFSEISGEELAKAFFQYPEVLKPVLSLCNVAARALERDLDIKNLNTYNPRLNEVNASILAGYIKPMLPERTAIESLVEIDRIFYIDKEIRKEKGAWEKDILLALNRHGKQQFRKRKFNWKGDMFELDAASPEDGKIKVGIDIKRVEARRDIHKRCDEIFTKAEKFKGVFPRASFGAVIYYPFVEEQQNIRDRLRSSNIDSVVFASEKETSITQAVKLLLGKVKWKK